MRDEKDYVRVRNKLPRQFNSISHRINFTGRYIIDHLFKTCSSSSYGIELWHNDTNINRAFHDVAIGYHKAVKKIAELCTWDCNQIS